MCEGRVLLQLALFAIIEELARRLGFPCIPTIKESDGGGEGRLFQESACDMAVGIDWDLFRYDGMTAVKLCDDCSCRQRCSHSSEK